MVDKILSYFGIRSQKPDLNYYTKIEGWLTPCEAKGLFEIASILPPKSIVLEIGSWKGKSTWCIAAGLKKGIINCIDPFNAAGEEGSKEIYEKEKGEISLLDQFNNNLQKVNANITIKTFVGYSNAFVGAIKNIDFLFVDGDHSIEGCKFDFEHYEKEIKHGGYLAFHDYYPERKDLGSTWVIDNLVKTNKAYHFHKCFDSLCVFKKI